MALNAGPWKRRPPLRSWSSLRTRLPTELGFTFADIQTGGASDGNYIAALGVPTLDGMGPVGGYDHSPDEYLETAEHRPAHRPPGGTHRSHCRPTAPRFFAQKAPTGAQHRVRQPRMPYDI